MDEGETKEAHVLQPVPYLACRCHFRGETARAVLERVVEAEAVGRVLDRRGLVAFAWNDAERVLWSRRFQSHIASYPCTANTDHDVVVQRGNWGE